MNKKGQMGELVFSIGGGLLLLIAIGTIILFVCNYSEREDCRMMSENGYETKIQKSFVFADNCFIKDDQLNKFVPFEKFRGMVD